MTPENAAFLRDFFAQGLERESQTTRKVLEAVPATNNTYKPDPKSRSGFELAWHIAATDAWFLAGVIAGNFDPATDQSAKVPENIKTPADIVAYYDKNFVANISKLSTLNPEKLATVTNFFGAFQLPLVVYLSFLNSHSIHHRGQLCAYLRAMGGKVPSIYGGSADEPFQMGASA